MTRPLASLFGEHKRSRLDGLVGIWRRFISCRAVWAEADFQSNGVIRDLWVKSASCLTCSSGMLSLSRVGARLCRRRVGPYILWTLPESTAHIHYSGDDNSKTPPDVAANAILQRSHDVSGCTMYGISKLLSKHNAARSLTTTNQVVDAAR